MSEIDKYPLGYSTGEARRLMTQAALLEPLFEATLLNAGLAKGMRVLDLGCGVGDVAFLAARMVGPTGSVVGVDRSAPSIETARKRLIDLDITNVEFKAAELEAFEPTGELFDAVIGRLVLLFLPNPSELLRRLRSSVRPGGFYAMQEVDMSVASQVPPSELFAAVNGLVFGAIDASGAQRDVGGKLLTTFLNAGLPWPQLSAITPVTSGPDSPYYEFLTEMVRSLLPTIERAALATRANIGLESLARRLQEDAMAKTRVLFPPRIVSAWCSLKD